MVKIDRAALEAFPLILPSLSEQRKIAAILGAVDETIEKTEVVIEQLQVVKKAMMQELLTRGLPGRHTRFKRTELGETPAEWSVLNLGELIAHGPDNGLYRPKTDYGRGAPIVRIDSFNNGEDLPSTGYQRVHLSMDDIKKYQLSRHDIVINRVNSLSHIGKTAFVVEMNEGTVFESNMMRFTVDPLRIQPRYAFYWLSSDYARGYFQSRAKRAVAQASINQEDVRGLPVPVPPNDEQAKIISCLDAVARRFHAEERLLIHLRATKAALMSVLLTGEVRVKPDEESP